MNKKSDYKFCFADGSKNEDKKNRNESPVRTSTPTCSTPSTGSTNTCSSASPRTASASSSPVIGRTNLQSNNNNSSTTNNNSPNNSQTPASTGNMSAPTRQVAKRRMRRRATSQSQDPAEQLTEMSVRGLNLFRYASISEGVYQCTECAKLDIQKTFKNKYSFQRHAFLYHEGHQRKVFPCPVCGKEFSRPDKMKNHMKTVHDCFMPKDCVMPFGFYLPP